MMLTAAGTAPKRSRICPMRATAYRVLNEERRASGLAPLTPLELNAFATLWELMQETSRIVNARKVTVTLFDVGGAS